MPGHPETIPDLLEGLIANETNIKYSSEKVLRRISEQRPELIFDRYFARISGPAVLPVLHYWWIQRLFR